MYGIWITQKIQLVYIYDYVTDIAYSWAFPLIS